MKVRLLEDKDGFWILLDNGNVLPVTKERLRNMLVNLDILYSSCEQLSQECTLTKWNYEYPDMQCVPGETYAYITDTLDVVISNFGPFLCLFDDVNYTIEDLIRASDYAKKHNRSVEQIKVLCRAGRIPGATKIGRDWVIPKDAPYPEDWRVY